MNSRILLLAAAAAFALALTGSRAAAQEAVKREVKEPPAAVENDRIGRYQMAGGWDGCIYVLDTATGQCWMRTPDGSWRDAGNPAKTQPEKSRKKAERTVPKLDLPEKTVEIVVAQREAVEIPGSDGTVRVRLGDITAGQVFLWVVTADDETLLRRTSLAQGDMVEFAVGKKRYTIHVKELRNILIGDDFAKIVVSEAEEKPAEKEEKGSADQEQ